MQAWRKADTALVHSANVGEGTEIEDYCIIGRAGSVSFVNIGKECRIWSHVVVYPDCIIGDRVSIFNKAEIKEGCVIGDDSKIGTMSIVEHDVSIGKKVTLHSGVFVSEYTIIEDDAWIGPRVVITNTKYPKISCKNNLQPVRVLSGARVGANSTILPGVTIGMNSIIGAGVVVTKDVPDNTVYWGKGWMRLDLLISRLNTRH